MKKGEFEKSLEQLEKLVGRLESGDLSLEESIRAFEEGMELSGVCEKHLNEAEKKISLLTKNKKGDFTEEEFEVEESDV